MFFVLTILICIYVYIDHEISHRPVHVLSYERCFYSASNKRHYYRCRPVSVILCCPLGLRYFGTMDNRVSLCEANLLINQCCHLLLINLNIML